HGIVIRQNQRNLQHVLAVKRHPSSAVGLIQMATRGKGSAAIKDPDVVQSEKATGEDVLPLRIFPVDPPVKIQHQALKRSFQETQIGPAKLLFHVVQKQRCPCMHGRIYVTEVPLISRNLSVGVCVQISQHEQQLVLSKVKVHQ